MELSQSFDCALIVNRDVSWYCFYNKFPVQQCKLFRDGFTCRIQSLHLYQVAQEVRKERLECSSAVVVSVAWYLPTVSEKGVKTLSLGNMNEIFSLSRSTLCNLETEKWNSTYLCILKEQYILQWEILSWNKQKQGPWKYIRNSNQLWNLQGSYYNIRKIWCLFAAIILLQEYK